jgi:hypothetical protein
MTEFASGDGATRLPALRACLRGVRRRWRIGALLASTVWSLVAALALLCGQKAATLLTFGTAMSGSFAIDVESAPLVGLVFGTFAVAFALGCVLTYLRTPDLRCFARAADQ